MTTRRSFIEGTVQLGAVAAIGGGRRFGFGGAAREEGPHGIRVAPGDGRLKAPEDRKIKVAFVISKNANVIDLAGAWEVLQDVGAESEGFNVKQGFELFTVSATTAPIRATGGLRLTPDYDVANAPTPDVISMGAQGGREPETIEWIKTTYPKADIVMSVCTGAFLLGATGLLDDQAATTHHAFYDQLKTKYPKIDVRRGQRFVEGAKIATAGGLTSGIDLALRVVDRYYGRKVAADTAHYMELQTSGWIL